MPANQATDKSIINILILQSQCIAQLFHTKHHLRMNNNMGNQALSTVHKFQNGDEQKILDGFKHFAALSKPMFLFGH